MGPTTAWKQNQWMMIGVFLGVLLAELMSKSVQPMLAWFIGGSVIGFLPFMRGDTRKPLPQSLAIGFGTGAVAAIAHYLVETVI